MDHRSLLRRLAPALLAALAWPAVAAAQTGVELVAPLAGDSWTAGGRAQLAWRETGPVPEHFEEWEAFLSLDGGVTWPYRLTPHLDRSRSRVEIDLPPVPTRRARLLLRFGDEEHETEWLVPGEFEILPGRPELELDPPRLAAAPGEPARPGYAGVTSWVEGPRDGRRTVRYLARDPAWGSASEQMAAGDRVPTAGEVPPRPPVSSPLAATTRTPRTRPATRATAPVRPDRALAASARLSRLGRRNE
jgi:hypothetical protein